MEKKEKTRRKILTDRNKLSEETVIRKSREIQENLFLLPEFKQARTVMFYVSKGKEVNTTGMLKETLEMDKRIAVPVSNLEDRTLTPYLITNLEELFPGAYGILEPRKEYRRPFSPEGFEFVIVPGIAFDYQGNRLGFGGGYYDKFLKLLSPSIPKFGLAYRFQVLDDIPSESHDISVNGIITEEEIFFVDRIMKI